MSATLFKEVTYSLSKLIEDIDMGEIGLPDIQRPFVWDNKKVRDLFDSMYKGFPVGYLLFWANGAGNGHRQIGADIKQKIPRLLIVDGQQRLTGLFAVLKGVPVVRKDYSRDRIRIAFRPRDRSFEVTDAAIRRNPEYIEDISLLWSPEVKRGRYVKAFIENLRSTREVSEDEADDLEEAIDRLYDLQNYPFTAMELSANLVEEQVAEVFVRINSKGKTLNQGDFILTLMSVFWDEGRAELEHFCAAARTPRAGEASPFNHFIQPDPAQLLRSSVALGFRRARLQHVYSLLRGKDLETERFSEEQRIAQFDRLQKAQTATLSLQNWHDFFKVLLTAGYLSSSMVSSAAGLLYSYALYLIGKLDFQVDQFTLRSVMARWYFMTSLTGRYTSSPETTMEQDLNRLRDVRVAAEFTAILDTIVRDTLTDDYWRITLPNELATSAARGPSLFGYHAALCVLRARGLYSNLEIRELLDPATRGTRSTVERHHLFPKAYLRKQGITEERDTNQIANFAWVEWADNAGITDMAPAEYAPQYEARFPSDQLRQMYYWHALPEAWYDMSYEDFIVARRRLIGRVIHDAFSQLSSGVPAKCPATPGVRNPTPPGSTHEPMRIP